MTSIGSRISEISGDNTKLVTRIWSRVYSIVSSVLVTMFLLSGIEASAAQKYLYLIGGGGDPDGTTTIFDSELKSFGKVALEAGYIPTIYFTYGHYKTHNLVAKSFRQSSSDVMPFSKNSYSLLLKKMTTDIEKGKYKAGDKLLFIIDSHGAYGSLNESDKAHDVSCEFGTCNVGMIEPLLSKLNDKGVKTALIDMSCFSGATLNLNLPGTCTMSMSSADSFSYTTDAEAFLDQIKKGRPLEQSFLDFKVEALSSPKIQSSAANKTEKALDVLTRVVRHATLNVWEDKFLKALYGDNEDAKNLIPLKSVDERLGEFLNHLPTELGKKLKNDSDLHDLVESLRGYDKERAVAVAELGHLWNLYTAGQVKEYYELRDSLKAGLFDGKWSRLRMNFKSPLGRAAAKVRQAENSLYRKIYEFFRKQEKHSESNNPCSDFSF